MPKTKISEYSTTNTDNSDIESINIAEGCAPSGINNAIRELMVHLKEFQTGSSGDPLTVAGTFVASGGATLSGTNTFSGSTVMAASAGTSASPSIYFSGDTNTGVFSPTADTIAAATGGAERLRIDSSGNVTLQKNISVGGATPTTSGTGITFPATQSASSDANTLDDYEEGTWTPNVGGTATYTTQTGHYTKIGRLIYVSFTLKINAIGTGSTSEISGLPFNTNAGIIATTGACYYDGPVAQNIIYLTGITTGLGDGKIQFYQNDAADGSVGTATIFGNGARVIGTFIYQI